MNLIFLFFISLITYVLSVDNPCQNVPFGSNYVDLTDFANENEQFQVNLNGGNKFLFNLCKPIPTKCSGQTTKALELFSGGECYTMAAEGWNDIKFEMIDEKSTSMIYSGGQVFHVQYNLASEIILICDESSALTETKYIGEKQTGNLMITSVSIKSSRLCPSNGRPFLWPVGILGLFLIFAIAALIGYLIIGLIVQIIRKKRGADIQKFEYIPNFKIWKGLALLVWDGVLLVRDVALIVFRKIKNVVNKRRGYTEQY